MGSSTVLPSRHRQGNLVHIIPWRCGSYCVWILRYDFQFRRHNHFAHWLNRIDGSSEFTHLLNDDGTCGILPRAENLDGNVKVKIKSNLTHMTHELVN